MPVYSAKYKIRNNDCDINSDIKASAILNLFQDIAGAQCEQYQIDQSEIIKNGICWVVAKQHCIIHRAPRFSETVLLETWPGKPLLSIMPRYYRISDPDGNVCVQGCAWWVLMDIESRTMKAPLKCGIDIPWEEVGGEIQMPRKIAVYDTFSSDVFRVPWSFCDINGHMNNTRYIDVCQDALYKFSGGRKLNDFTIEYSGEAYINDEILLEIGRNGDYFSVNGNNGKKIFSAQFKFGEA